MRRAARLARLAPPASGSALGSSASSAAAPWRRNSRGLLQQVRPISRDAYREMHRRSLEDKEGFWGDAARGISWAKPFDSVLQQLEYPFYRWFPGGSLNMCYNAVDRHVEAGHGSRAALYYDSPVTGQKQAFSYAELKEQVARLAGVLAAHGVGKGDRVVIYMPMIPEAVFAMLACARLGAPHSVVFGGFAAHELAARLEDARPKMVIAASCGVEPSHVVEYKPMLDEALALLEHQPEACLIKQRPQHQARLGPKDVDWDTAMARAQPHEACVAVDSSDPLYILYTSGTTGKPKGVVRDTAGHAVALKWSMDNFMNTYAGETYWAASDIGWVVGHSFIVYGPLLQGCATVLYEGKPVGTPDAGALWRIIEEYKVRGFFVAPTGLRAVRRQDPNLELIGRYDISSLRGVFVAGERCDPETSRIFASALGTPIYDNWWQTETGSPICGFQFDDVGRKDGSTSLPMPGYDLGVRSEAAEAGEAAVEEPGAPGALVARLPLPPGAFPTLWNNDEGYLKGYMSTHEGFYTTGDAGVVDADGYVTVLERTDDVMNVAAHRLSCGALEASVKELPDINDCAIVGAACELKGQVPVVLVVTMAGVDKSREKLAEEVVAKVRHDVGAIATPAAVGVVEQLPKTRSGKVLRKNIRGLADGKAYPVPGTIEDPAALQVVQAELSRLGFPRRSGTAP